MVFPWLPSACLRKSLIGDRLVLAVGEDSQIQLSQACVTLSRREGHGLMLAFAGTWKVATERPSLSSVLAQISAAAVPEETVPCLILDGRDLTDWDSQFLVFLRKLSAELEKLGVTVNAENLPEGARRLLALANAVPVANHDFLSPEVESLPLRVGLGAHDIWDSFMAFMDFLGATVIAMGRLLRRRARFPVSDFAVIIQDTGVRALSIVSLIAVLVGLIIAFVGSVQLNRFGAGVFTADMVAIAMLREMGALMTAIIMAGRTGAAFAAELATMQVNEEIDALATLGIDPVEYLVLPRVLALCLMMPLLCLYADLMGILGGAVIGVTILDIPLFEYWTRTTNSLSFTNLAIGVVKAGVFGGLIALAGCLRGLSAGRSAAAVGEATTAAVVLAIVLIVASDGLFAVILNILGI